MKNKYYTPSVEEFHVGFELETIYAKDNWTNVLLTNNNIGYYCSTYEIDSYSSEFRVKYLDIEDIESLGFEQVRNDFKYTFSNKNGIVINMSNNPNNTIQNICIFKVRLNDTEILFNGSIKNKSELKKVLQTIGVL